jgi:hypothetical protein
VHDNYFFVVDAFFYSPLKDPSTLKSRRTFGAVNADLEHSHSEYVPAPVLTTLCSKPQIGGFFLEFYLQFPVVFSDKESTVCISFPGTGFII